MELRGIPLWSFALYAQKQPFTAESRLDRPVKVFSSLRIRASARHPHTRADPFLFVRDDCLYVFYEQVVPGGVGKIACIATADLQSFRDLGVVLSEDFHLSYPFVFSDGGSDFMLPEAQRSGQVILYRFVDFPSQLEQVRVLLNEPLADAFLVPRGEHWYLFGTSARGLELFVSADLLEGDFAPHPKTPVTADPRFCRSGGGPVTIDGKLVRVAQDCSRSYGANVSLIGINELTPTTYNEELLKADLFSCAETWNRDGGHHLSTATFNGDTVIAADGKHRDYFVNKLLYRLYR